MRKRILPLLLALALTLCLTVPALAAESSVMIGYSEGDGITYAHPSGVDSMGSGWNYSVNKNGPDTLSLNDLHSSEGGISITDSLNIYLAPGKTSSVLNLVLGKSQEQPSIITFSGTGELILNTTSFPTQAALAGFFDEIKLEDGLTITGGTKAGDTHPLTIRSASDQSKSYMMGDTHATYIRIGPAVSSDSGQPSSLGFTDVPANSPFKAAIDWAVGKNITKGITATTFGPGNKCTISHILTFLYRASGEVGTLPTEKENVYDWAVNQLGAPGGGWEAPCNRVMAVEFIWSAAGCPEPSKTVSFTDLESIPADSPSMKAIAWAVEKGITTGTSASTFAPDSHCTRGQIVTFLYRASQAGAL